MKEKHIILESDTVTGLLQKENETLGGLQGWSVAMRRYFLSSAEQKKEFPSGNGAVSYIVQPPLDGSTAAVWLYLISDVQLRYGKGITVASEDGLEYVWTAGITADGADSREQTESIFTSYEKDLSGMGMSLEDNCVRTWLFVDDIDSNYAGVVVGRRENFKTVGLVPQTHYIASTGIAGTPCREGALVQMDAYSIKGKYNTQYLHAPEFLNPTYEYGVTFERGVKLDFGDSARILISGTASIDNRGEVLFKGDVCRQTLRMWENVEALLAEAGSGWEDVRQVLVYLRNAEDYAKVAEMFRNKFRQLPYIILKAPVCRPDWLVEMECIAYKR